MASGEIDFNKLIDETGREFLARPDVESAFLYLRATVGAGLNRQIGWEVAEQVLMQIYERLVDDDAAMRDLSIELQALGRWVAAGASESYMLRQGIKP